MQATGEIRRVSKGDRRGGVDYPRRVTTEQRLADGFEMEKLLSQPRRLGSPGPWREARGECGWHCGERLDSKAESADRVARAPAAQNVYRSGG